MASTSTNRMVEVRNDKTGLTTKIKESSWANWSSPKAKDNDIRHGYRLIRTFTVDATGKEISSEPVLKAKTFVPKLPPSALATGAPQKAETAPPAQQEQQEQPPNPQGKSDNLAAIPALGLKVAQALNDAGVNTYKQLAEADPKALKVVLDGMVPPMSPKAAQIPAWQKAAMEFVKQAESAQA